MRHNISKYFSLIVVATAFFSVACSTMTEKEREERDYARAEWQNQYIDDWLACRARGGKWVYDGTAELDRNGVPKHRVYYACS